jgi:hypothetical protein
VTPAAGPTASAQKAPARGPSTPSAPAASATPTAPHVSTDQEMIEGRRVRCVDLGDVSAVFRLVFRQLPAQVRVYPTENYYYFRFDCDSREVWGNLRLDAEGRDQGVIEFAYFYALNRPEKMEDLTESGGHRSLGPADGVRVTRAARLVYDVAFGGKTVRFRLNDVDQTPPPRSRMLPTERFIERCVDESGFRFDLLYDDASKGFRFVLEPETPLPDVLVPFDRGIVVGRISGFAFYVDAIRDRSVLIAIDADNMRRNNYYDGPFDQLGDNFLTDERRRAMEEAYPYVRGRIDRRGVFVDASGKGTGERLALTPFFTYNGLEDLRAFIARSRQAAGDDAALIAALTWDYKKAVPAAGSPAATPAVSPAPPPAAPTPPGLSFPPGTPGVKRP